MRCASFLGALSLLAHVELVRAVPQPAAPVEQAGLVPSLVLVGPNGAANGQLVVPAAPNWMETAAAMELNLQIFKATGANLTIVHEPQAVAGTPALYVGATEAARKASIAKPAPEGYSIVVSDDTAAYIVGDDHCNVTWPNKITDNSECRRGSLFGAFALLRHLGFGWLWPGAGGEIVPDLSTGVSLAIRYNVSDAPEIAMRRYRPIYGNVGEVYGRYAKAVPWLINNTLITQLAKEEAEWLTHSGMGSHSTPQWGQAFESWWAEWGANGTLGQHPEWFALLPPNTEVNPSAVARRGPWMHDGHAETAGTKMCVSNARLHEQVAKGYVSGTPGVSACEDDGDQGFCTCDKCRQWDARSPLQGPDSMCFNHTHQNWHKLPPLCRGQYSDRYARFWDAVAAVLAKQYPDSPPTVTGYAYDNYRDPPLNYTLTGNVMVGLVVGVFGDANATNNDKALWSGWHAKGAKKMFWRPNIGGGGGYGPSQNSVNMAETLKWLAEHGLDATDMDSMDNHWALSGFTYFVTAHAQWHPTTFDRDSALAKYSAVGFGPSAASHAKAYIDFWETWSQSPERAAAELASPGCSNIPFVYTPDLLRQASDIIKGITAACGDYPGCEAKAAFWKEGITHAELTNAAIVARNTSKPCPTDRSCFIGGGTSFLATSLKLVQFRRSIAAGSAVNVFEQSMKEVQSGDCTGISAAATVEPLLLPSFAPVFKMTENDWVPTPWSICVKTPGSAQKSTKWFRSTRNSNFWPFLG
jgi:hypothetical protein